jgi:hypothetical protein
MSFLLAPVVSRLVGFDLGGTLRREEVGGFREAPKLSVAFYSVNQNVQNSQEQRPITGLLVEIRAFVT